MLKNYLTVTLRNLIGQPVVSVINLIGFALGLAVCFFIWLFAQYQLSYDSWLPEADTIYRLESTTHVPGRGAKPVAQAPGIARDFLKDEFEEVMEAVRFIPYPEAVSVVRLDGEPFRIQTTLVDDGFFDIFQLEFLAGDPATALADNNSFVLTASTAMRLFGTVDAVGRVLEAMDPLTREPVNFRVTGILADLPANSHMPINILARFDPVKFQDVRSLIGSWFLRNTYMYLKLRRPEDIHSLRAGIPDFITRHIDTSGSEVLSALSPTEFMEFHLVRTDDIYLHSRTTQQLGPIGDIRQVRIFLLGAALVLAVAVINFINLATARTSLRAREVLMRKILGARRKQLTVQFVGEAIILSAISFFLALGLMELTLPLFNQLAGIEFTRTIFAPSNLVIFGSVALLSGLVAGLYPALLLSNLKPGGLMQRGASAGRNGVGFRNLLVVFQFAISIAMIISVLVVSEQVQFANSADVGFRRDNLMVVRLNGASDRWQTVREQVGNLAGVRAVTATSNAPTDEGERQINVVTEGQEGPVRSAVSHIGVDARFFDVMGIRFLAGRGMNEDEIIRSIAADDTDADAPVEKIVLNRSALILLGFGGPAEAIGQQISLPDGAQLEIIGVIPDLYYRSIHNEVRPTVYGARGNLTTLLVDIDQGADQTVIPAIRDIWRMVQPALPLSYRFTDDLVAQKYAGESRQLEMMTLFAGLAALIATIGVFGLSLFTIERRFREIAIRKVLGAGILNILQLLIWQFSKPVVLANLIAWPVAFYFMQNWLEGFAYRIDLTLMPFVMAAFIALIVAWSVVSLLALKAARTNPIHALRYE